MDTDDTYGQTAISQLRLFDGTELPDATGTPIAEGMLPTGQANRDGALQIVSSSPDVLQVFEESEVGPAVIDPPAGVETVFPYGFMVRYAASTSTRTLAASPAPGEFTGVVTFAFTVPLQPTSADDPFEISAMFLAMDDSDTRVTQSLEEQAPAGQAALDARAASLGASEVNLLPDGNSTGPIAARLLCRVRTAGTAASPTAFLANAQALVSLSPDPYATGGSGSRITLPTFIAASFGGAVDDADANTFVVHGAQTGRHFLGEAYSGNGTATVTSPQVSANAFFPGEEIVVSLTQGFGACPHVARLRVGVNSGDGTFAAAVNHSVADPNSIAAGDLDGDGDLDIAMGDALSNDVSVLLNNGTGTFASEMNYNAEASARAIAVSDLDGDGDLDIATGNGGSGDVSVLLNNGNGAFAAAVKYNTDGRADAIAVGDLDGDGDPTSPSPAAREPLLPTMSGCC